MIRDARAIKKEMGRPAADAAADADADVGGAPCARPSC